MSGISFPGWDKTQMANNCQRTPSPQAGPQHSQPKSSDKDSALTQSETESGMTLSQAGYDAALTEETLLPLVIQQLHTAYPGFDPKSPQSQALALQQTRVMLQELYSHNLTTSMHNLTVQHDLSQSATPTTGHHSQFAALHESQPQMTTTCQPESITKQKTQAAAAATTNLNRLVPSFIHKSQPAQPPSSKGACDTELGSYPQSTKTRPGHLEKHCSQEASMFRSFPAAKREDNGSSDVMSCPFYSKHTHSKHSSTTPWTEQSTGIMPQCPPYKMKGQPYDTQLSAPPKDQATLYQEATTMPASSQQKNRSSGHRVASAQIQNERFQGKNSRQDNTKKNSNNPRYTPLSTQNWGNDTEQFPEKNAWHYKPMNIVSSETEDWDEDITPYPRNIIGYYRPSDTLLMSSSTITKVEENLSHKNIPYGAGSKATADCTSQTVRCLKSGTGSHSKQEQPKTVPPVTAAKVISSRVPEQPKAEQPKAEQPQQWTKVKKRGKAAKKQK